MTVTARRNALRLFVETADDETIDAMYLLFIGKHSTHDIYGFYTDKLPHLQFPVVETPVKNPDIVKPVIAKSGTKKTGRTKK